MHALTEHLLPWVLEKQDSAIRKRRELLYVRLIAEIPGTNIPNYVSLIHYRIAQFTAFRNIGEKSPYICAITINTGVHYLVLLVAYAIKRS